VLEALRAEVLEANLELVRRGLVIFTFGNASAVSREHGLCVIKPSGVPYESMTPADMVITDLEGNLVEGSLRPSSDLATHVALYRAFPEIGGVVHTHSRHATAWAQANREIPCFGTTHADYFHGEIPITAQLSREEIETGYEANTGAAIIARMKGIHPLGCPACLVSGHAPFTWGKTVKEAAQMAAIVEKNDLAPGNLATRMLQNLLMRFRCPIETGYAPHHGIHLQLLYHRRHHDAHHPCTG